MNLIGLYFVSNIEECSGDCVVTKRNGDLYSMIDDNNDEDKNNENEDSRLKIKKIDHI